MRYAAVLAKAIDPAKTTLAQVMTHIPATTAPRITAIEALRLMQDGGYRHPPIVQSDQVVGAGVAWTSEALNRPASTK